MKIQSVVISNELFCNTVTQHTRNNVHICIITSRKSNAANIFMGHRDSYTIYMSQSVWYTLNEQCGATECQP